MDVREPDDLYMVIELQQLSEKAWRCGIECSEERLKKPWSHRPWLEVVLGKKGQS